MPSKTLSGSTAVKGRAKKAESREKSATATSRKRTVKAATTAQQKAKPAPKLGAAKKSATTRRAVKRTRKTAPPAAPVAVMGPVAFHEAVAHSAYRLWEQKGRPEGSAEQDWRQAEQEMGMAQRI